MSRLAQVALFPPAAFAVHQLRYLLAYGGQAGVELQRTGHSYLHSVVPWIVLLLALVAGGFLRALGRACAGQTSLPRYSASLVGMWCACSACLVAIFACQELLEGFRDWASRGARRDLRLWRLVVDPGGAMCWLGARGLVARRSLGAAGGGAAPNSRPCRLARPGAAGTSPAGCGGSAAGAARRGLVGSGSAGVS